MMKMMMMTEKLVLMIAPWRKTNRQADGMMPYTGDGKDGGRKMHKENITRDDS
jgi:hypothetical protein